MNPMREILQEAIPYDVYSPRPLPGVAPLDPRTWLHRDEAFAQQMALRSELITNYRDRVIAQISGAEAACAELLNTVLCWLGQNNKGYDIAADKVLRPDGVEVPIKPEDPLGTLGQMIQEDLCLMQKNGDEHELIAAVLCFPASWRLSEKIGRPLIGIHKPVPEYDAGLAARVQRLFDGVQVDMPLWRFNVLHYAQPELFQPRSEQTPRALEEGSNFPYIRSERQCVLRLPKTKACVFSIHTYVLKRDTSE